jgi:penicillin G amidase
MRTCRNLLGFAVTTIPFAWLGCGSSESPLTPDAAPPDHRIEELPVAETVHVPGLSAPVEVVVDTRGAPHIYGANLSDVIQVQGYLMARDRFGQMEFFRRAVLGRLSEALGGINPQVTSAVLAMDEGARFIGYNRMGKAIYDSLAPGDPSRQVAEAFVAGVNQRIDEIKALPDRSAAIPPGAEVMFFIYGNDAIFDHWAPADVFALGRFEAVNLSYNPQDDIDRTKALKGVTDNLGPKNPLLAGAYADLFSEVQGRRVYTLQNYYPTNGTKMARGPAPNPTTGRPAVPAFPSSSALDAAQAYFARQRELFAPFHIDGSNNWVVSGQKTASGAPILANDPHLSLISPGVWWFSHLNTKRVAGPAGVNVNGVAFAGIPGVVLGFNENLAWGATITGYDVTDVYLETVTEGATPTVLFNGAQVPIQTITETIKVNGGPDVSYVIEVVPHHGSIVPGTHANGQALSVRYTGNDVSNELAYFLGLASARNVDEAWAAQAAFKVGSENFVVVSRDGEIAWNTQSRIPVRDPRALTLTIDAHGMLSGFCPTFVLPGTGDYEWIGDMDASLIPKARNPAQGFIATANQDNVGVTDDGNPCNQPDHFYLGGGFANGYREGRIVERLSALTATGGITLEDMRQVQAETRSQLGDTLRDPLVAILTGVINDGAAPFTSDEKAQLAVARDHLAVWSRKTPHGIGATDPAEIADSVATTIFNVALRKIIPLAFKDEADAIGVMPSSETIPVLLERAVTAPQKLATYDSVAGDTVLWDDVSTPDVVETKSLIVAKGFLAAMADLTSQLGADPSAWRWGLLHTVRFKSLLPTVISDQISIPAPDDPTYGHGYPRHGDIGAIDVGNFNPWAYDHSCDGQGAFCHGSGSSQRLLVEMLPTGPVARNALPGGQNIDRRSPHHADEAALWIQNQNQPVNFLENDVVTHAEARRRFVP